MKKKSFLILLFSLNLTIFGQNYVSYFTGNSTDTLTQPYGGICLMGGATDNDEAIKWLLKKANGGDVLVLRTSGSNGYNNYMYSSLGVSVNSVETIVFNNRTASYDNYIQQKINQAEAIWIAGGNQWNYVSYWRNSPVDSLINKAIKTRNIAIGGTSAGMAILGGLYFTAQNGTVTSSSALSNPFNSKVTVDSASFISNKYLSHIITDTHYDDPDRKGRHVVFLSRILIDYGIKAKGIACDEYTAVCLDTNGIAVVYGNHPTYDDNAYFIQTNCELSSITPENCTSGNPLNWNLGNKAIKVYSVKGTVAGTNYLDLKDWQTGFGGTWENWFVNNGILIQQSGNQPNCNGVSVSEIRKHNSTEIYPNPSSGEITINFKKTKSIPKSLKILNSLGQTKRIINEISTNELKLRIDKLPTGIYFIEFTFYDNSKQIKKLIISSNTF
ncbi:MAG: T9SS type A sorting domain-containing protein [Flavobacteriales bacterium]